MNKILIGTGNKAKLNTYKELLKGFNLEVVSAKDLKIPAPEEQGQTFEEEAIHKAKYYHQKSGLPTLVDDGGMQIKALNDEPGTKSHRWIGRQMKDQEIIDEVMKRMKAVPKEDRHCRFTVAIAIATSMGIYTAEAEMQGVVGQAPSDQGVEGYPYDAVMYLPNYGKFVCELPDSDYAIVNVRRHALEKLTDVIKELEE